MAPVKQGSRQGKGRDAVSGVGKENPTREGRVLQVKGEREEEEKGKEVKWHCLERSRGKFQRRYRLCLAFGHTGWNSVLESVSQGVPMLCWPCFGDQRINVRFVSYIWRVGLQLGTELKSKNIEEGIKKIMISKEGKEMRERAMVLKNNS